MLLSGKRIALGLELSQCAADAEAGVAWLNHVVNVAVFGCLIWIGKQVVVFLLLFGDECAYVFASFLLGLGFLGLEDCGST